MSIIKKFFVSKGFRTFINYLVISLALFVGVYIGRVTSNYPPKPTVAVNPYSKPFKSNEISIAVNESDELLLIDRKTGKYSVYSDEIGYSIFKMYTKKLYDEAN